MSTATVKKTENKLEQVFAMWKHTSKKKLVYFAGKTKDGQELRGFYNTDKKNLKEPDLRIYRVDGDGNLDKETFLSLWCNASDTGKKYLTGKLEEKRVVGFINEKADSKNKQPYLSIYWSDENGTKTEKKPTKQAKKEEPETDSDLPF